MGAGPLSGAPFRWAATGVGLALLLAALYVYPLPDFAEEPPLGPPDSGLSGAEVAQRYCQSCHALPTAEQLPKETWPFAINWMGNYLGYKKLSPPYGHITARHRIPAEPLVSPAEMSRLGRHYIDGAREAKDFVHGRERPPSLAGYAASALPEAGEDGEVVTLLHVDEARGHLYVGLGNAKALLIFDRDRELRVRIALPTEPIHIEPRDRGFRLTMAGDYARDEHDARIADFDFADDEWNGMRQRMLASGLHRTTESRAADLDGDGREDLVVVSFGDGFGAGYGKVSILWATPEYDDRVAAAPPELNRSLGPLLPGAFEEQVLLDRAGGLGAEVVDINGDGHLDVLVLATQGDNELVAYLGQGERRFERHVIDRRHVSFGYNQFLVRDMNGDGHLDLITVNGNNMELKSPPLRPYHGVRVLLGDGALGFEEAAFFPMYGALTAVAQDFDGDGDVDIAVNSFFPNWFAKEPETFDVLENVGDLQFEPQTLGGEHWGRWLRIAAGDLDGDGRVELFLGGGNSPGGGLHPDRPRQWARYRERLAQVPAVLVLDRSSSAPATSN